MILKQARNFQAFRIAPTDTNYFACLFDPLVDGAQFTMVVEIFAPGGATPPTRISARRRCSSCWQARASRGRMARRTRSGRAMP